jgi:predicted O-linked N-acetylglucosamine transferase (SPINDLY family)
LDNFEKAKDLFLDGVALLGKARFLEAEIKFLASLEAMPNRISTLLNLSAAQIDLKKFELAKTTLSKVLQLEKNNAEAYLNLGLIETKLKKFEVALELVDTSTKLSPTYFEAWSNKGNTLNELKRYDEAIASYDKAISLNPEYPEAWSNKGNTLNELKRYDEAIASYDRAISLKSKGNHFLGNLLHAKMVIASWENFDSDVQSLVDKIKCGDNVTLPFPPLSIIDDPALHLVATKIFVNEKFPANNTLPELPKTSHQKIRIGYFSPDFKSHPVSFLTAELFELHDRNHFEIYAFSLQPASPGDAMRARLSKGFDRFIDVESKSDLEIAQLARALEIDIAVDLGGHTQHARIGIFSHRAAPIQVNYLGYPGTLGAHYIDYIIGDKTLIPAHSKASYVEKVIYLPHTYMADDSTRRPSTILLTRKDVDLPADKFIFCCFNNSYKFNPNTLESWANILKNVPQSILWISENNASFRRNLLNEFSKLEITSERITFAKRIDSMAEHLARYCLADLFLDTLPFNAHTTAIDALKAGLPILTLIGESFAGRVVASLLAAINLQGLITTSPYEYESLAIKLATDSEQLAYIRNKLAVNQLTSPLFNTPLFTQHLELAYDAIYKRHQAGLPPDHLYI